MIAARFFLQVSTLVQFGASPKALVRVVVASDGCHPVAFQFDEARLGDSIAHMGGTITQSTRPERVDVSVDVLSQFAPAAIGLLAQVVRSPQRDGDRRANRPGLDSAATDAFDASVYPDGQFSGCAHSSSSHATAIGPRAIRVIVAGRFDTAMVRRAIGGAFGDWAAGSAPDAPSVAPSDRPAQSALVFVQRPGAKQVALMVGAPTPGPTDSDFARLRVMNTVLGAGVVSRITRNIREAKGYAYSPSSFIAAAPSGAAYWAEVADVAADVAEPALREIVGEITRLGDAPPDSAEVAGAERYLIGRALFETSTRAGLADALEDGTAVGGAPSVTGTEVQQVARTYLAPTRLTIVVVGDTMALGPNRMAAIRAMHERR